MQHKDAKKDRPVCGLCGKSKKLTKTPCCNQWICDDTDTYVMFSYARTSCSRNHDRYTLCSSHFSENHTGDWKTCKKCRDSFDAEDYVWYGTNEYNFEKLPNPPKFAPTHCSQCNRIINRGEEGYAQLSGGNFLCETCGWKHLETLKKDHVRRV